MRQRRAGTELADVMHDRDEAKPGVRLTMCGDCLLTFPGKTAAESAALAKAHIEAGCPKKRPRPDAEEAALWG